MWCQDAACMVGACVCVCLDSVSRDAKGVEKMRRDSGSREVWTATNTIGAREGNVR